MRPANQVVSIHHEETKLRTKSSYLPPFCLERMDEHWEHEGHARRKLTKEKPSYYCKRQCWASCEAGEKLAPIFVEHVGADYLTIATDYPHGDCIGKCPDRTVGDLTK